MFIAVLFRIARTWKQPKRRWMDTYTGVHSNDGILFNTENKWAIKLQKTWRKCICTLTRERNQSEKATYCRIPTRWRSVKDTTIETVVVRGLKERGVNRQSTKDFYGSENTLYGTIMVNTCHYTFVETHRKNNMKSEPYCKLQSLGDNDVSM